MNPRAIKLLLPGVIVLFLSCSSFGAVVSFSIDVMSTAQFDELQGYYEDSILSPASIFPPVLRFTGKGGPGIEVNGISYGSDSIDTNTPYFSVGGGSLGLPGSAVNDEPAAERGADIYRSARDGSNVQIYDGNGSSAAPLGLPEPNSTNLDALDMRSDQTMIYWTVDFDTSTGANEYTSMGGSSADIFVGAPLVGYSTNPVIYASDQELGLGSGDDIDALVVVDDGVAGYDSSTDKVYFSLTSGSPRLDLLGFKAADILVTGGGSANILVYTSAADLGLNANFDDLDALDYVPEPGTITLLLCGLVSLICWRRRL